MGKKKDPSRPRGRMSAYAYFVQDRRTRMNPNQQVVFTVFSKECAERWRNMGDVEKQPFNDKSASDKIRYDREMSTYVPPKDKKTGKGGRRRAKKDPDAPKRNLSAFFLFSRDERGAIKKVHPEWSVGKIAQQLAAQWRNVTQSDRAKYDAEASLEKERYLREMAAFKASKPKVPTKKVQRKESSSSSSSDDSSSDDSSSDSDSDEE